MSGRCPKRILKPTIHPEKTFLSKYKIYTYENKKQNKKYSDNRSLIVVIVYLYLKHYFLIYNIDKNHLSVFLHCITLWYSKVLNNSKFPSLISTVLNSSISKKKKYKKNAATIDAKVELVKFEALLSIL